jgi:hypothetical protein
MSGAGERKKISLGKIFAGAVKTYLFFPLYSKPKTCANLLKKLAVIFAVQQALHFGGGRLMYPTVQQELVRSGFSESAAEKLAPRFIPTIVTPTLKDSTFSYAFNVLTRSPTIGGIGVSTSMVFFENSDWGNTVVLGGCSISLPLRENYNQTDILTNHLGVDENDIHTSMPDELMRTYTLIHESNHCSLMEFLNRFRIVVDFLPSRVRNHIPLDSYAVSQNNIEAASDLKAINAIANELKIDEIKKSILYRRAASPDFLIGQDFIHDISLKIDAELHRTIVPSGQDIINSRHELSRLVIKRAEELQSINNRKYTSKNIILLLIEATEDVLQSSGESLSPFARRRGQLFLLGVSSVIPDLVQETLGQIYIDFEKDNRLQKDKSFVPDIS